MDIVEDIDEDNNENIDGNMYHFYLPSFCWLTKVSSIVKKRHRDHKTE